MPKLSTATIENILSKFNKDITNYEIINLEELQGWSSKYLYLIVSEDDDYILKGKTDEQMAGFEQENNISDLLKRNNFLTRDAINTIDNKSFYRAQNVNWTLKTYIPGSAGNTEEYTSNTISTMAALMGNYLTLTLNQQHLKQDLLLNTLCIDKNLYTNNILPNVQALQNYIPDEINVIHAWHNEFYSLINNLFEKNTDFAVIHNDINTKNILIDHKTKNTITYIDWDHVIYGSPLKDICDTLNMFYDYLSIEKYTEFREIFITELNKKYKIKLTSLEIELLQKFFYTQAKWSAILFYFRLLQQLGNTTNEQTRFENEIKINARVWLDNIKQK